MLLLFFGYVESYPPAWAAFSGFVCFSLRYITIGRGLIFSSIFLIIGIVFHLQLALYIPAFIFLLISRGPGQKFYEKYRHPIRIMIGFSIGLAFYIFVRKYQSDLYFENIFLPLFNGKPLAPYYALLSLPHLADIANQLLLLSPLLPLIAVLSLRRFWNISLGKKEMFLSITAVFGLIFLFIIDPKLGMPRDWDLFSFSALAPTLLLISLIPERMTINLQRFIPSIGIFLIAALLPYLAINLDRDSSVNYFKYMINLDMPKSQSSWNTLRDYCNLNGDPRSADSLDYYFCINFPNENKMDLAFSALDNNNLELAETLLSLIKPDRLSSNYHNLKSEIYYHQGNTGPALVELKKAIQLRQYDALLYYNLSIIYAASKQYEEAYVALKKGYGFDSTHNEILTGLAGYHLILGDPDSMEIYARKLIGLDSTNHYAYQLLSEMYDLRNNRKLAAKYYDLHLKYRATDTTSDSVPSEFQQRMEMIKSNKH
jgi:tetratricopeptide (TPR) repeat protein